MENTKNDKRTETPDNEGYDINNPQNLTQPKFNSTTEHREGSGLPYVENLNQTEGKKDELKPSKNDNNDPLSSRNDESLHGNTPKSDLGNGQRDEDEDEKEKIIRT